MTRRERLERKLEKRQQWAANAEQRSNEEMQKSTKALDGIVFGQPILVGHHSEKKHRAAIDRSQRAADRSLEAHHLAKHHRDKAEGLADQLENTIFSDDPDAVQTIEAKIADLENRQELYKHINKVCRLKKATDAEKLRELIETGMSEEKAAEMLQEGGVPSWALTNNNANIRRYKQRLVAVKAQQQRKAAAESAANGVCVEVLANGYCRVTFAEKPEREVINALKAAGFYWYGGCWRGEKSKLPAQAEELAQ